LNRIERKFSITPEEISRVIEMAWEDRTPFDAIYDQFELSEPQVIEIMRYELKGSSFRMWRARVHGRVTKHTQRRLKEVTRAYCATQYKVK
jgi:uncharacterized protein (TIGR03643 family)